LKIVEPGGAGRLSLVGVDGHVDLRAGSSSRELCLVADCDLSANAPDDLSPLTSVFRLQGFEGALARPAEIEIKLPVEGLEAVDLSRMAVYRLHEGRFTRLPGGWRDGWIRGETILDGHFIVALGEADNDGGGAPTPVDYTILRAYPNPFNQSTQLVFNLREAGTVSLSVFDLTGRRVAYLVNDEFAAGQHRLAWAGLSDEGVYLPSGIYWTRLVTAEHAVVVKLLLVR